MLKRVQENSGIIAWVVGLAYFCIADCVIIHKNWQSLTAVPQKYRKDALIGPALLGFWLALTYHFFCEKAEVVIRYKSR